MDAKEVENHHLLFYIAAIFCIYVTKFLFFDCIGINCLEMEKCIIQKIFWLIMAYLVGLFVFVKKILFLIYSFLSGNLLGKKYRAKNLLGSGDFYLTSTSIITVFIVDGLLEIIKNPIIVFPLAGFLFYVIYWLNQKI